MSLPGSPRVAVVGAGLIGGSIARRLQARGMAVSIADPSGETRALAERDGISAFATVGEWIKDCELVVLATPLDSFESTARTLRKFMDEGQLLIDVGSVKEPVLDIIAAEGLDHLFVGCHPMAGTEFSGYAHADPDLLVDVTWVLVPPTPARTPSMESLVRFLLTHFAATVVLMDARTHDRCVAVISHLPHVTANSLLAVLERSEVTLAARFVAAGSFRDGTRVAGRDPRRTANMIRGNAKSLVPVIDDFLAIMTSFRDALQREESEGLAALLESIARDSNEVRDPQPMWHPAPDLPALIERASSEKDVAMIRLGRDGEPEWARLQLDPVTRT